MQGTLLLFSTLTNHFRSFDETNIPSFYLFFLLLRLNKFHGTFAREQALIRACSRDRGNGILWKSCEQSFVGRNVLEIWVKIRIVDWNLNKFCGTFAREKVLI